MIQLGFLYIRFNLTLSLLSINNSFFVIGLQNCFSDGFVFLQELLSEILVRNLDLMKMTTVI